MKPFCTIRMPHSAMDMYKHGGCYSWLDGEAKPTPAAPQKGQTLIDCLGHELGHHLAALALWDGPSRCLANGGRDRQWTDAKRREERLALMFGPILADFLRAAQRLPFERLGNPARKLTPEEVRAIRKEYVPRKVSMQTLAEKYGVTDTAIDRILKHETYKDVKEEAIE